MERKPNYWDTYNSRITDECQKLMYSYFGERLEDLVKRLPEKKIYQLGNDLRGKARWFAKQV